MNPWIEINQRRIGPGKPTYIIAEMSANHNQDFDKALAIIQAAKDAGADAIKIQTYTADTLTINCDKEPFQIKGLLWDGKVLYDLYKEAYTPWEWQPKLKQAANDLGMDLFSSPFDHSAITFLEELDMPAYKIASPENIDIPLIQATVKTGKPIIISTGMATLDEIEAMIQAVKDAGGNQLALLKCTSAYPTPPEQQNLRVIPDLKQRFQIPIGLSDHTMGIVSPVTAVSLGACIIEKHFTLSRDDPGPDSAFSLEPHEFKAMVEAVRHAEKSLGQVTYEVTGDEAKTRAYRRSLFVVKDIKAGDTFSEDNVRSIRPGQGLMPCHYDTVLGKQATQDIERGTPLSWELVQQ